MDLEMDFEPEMDLDLWLQFGLADGTSGSIVIIVSPLKKQNQAKSFEEVEKTAVRPEIWEIRHQELSILNSVYTLRPTLLSPLKNPV